MDRVRSRLIRFVSTLVSLAVVAAAVLAGAPARAHADGPRTTLFRAEFDSAPVGPLSAPLAVEAGTIVPQEGSAAIVTATAGRALVLDGAGGQSTALMQWRNFPGALPVQGNREQQLAISGEFASSTTAGTTSFGLLSGSNFFEFFSFGPGGSLTRAGQSLGLSYAISATVRLDARIEFARGGNAGLVRVTLRSGGARSFVVPLDSAFTLATLNQLRLQVASGGGSVTTDRLLAQLKTKGDDDEPPAVIIIGDDDIEREIEVIGGITFISIKITIINTGGDARGVFLILDRDDLDDLDLAEISFLDGIGFVSTLDDARIVIGLGQNNIIRRDGKVKVKVRMKVKATVKVDVKVNMRFRLTFGDSAGSQEVVLAPVPVVVPVIVQPVVVVQRLPISAIDVRFTGFWRSRGGLEIFGLPLTGPITRADGIVVQYFERARLEFHPDLRGTPYEILIGLLGVELGYSTPQTTTTAPTDTVELRWYFPATGHLIGRPFRTFWQSRGGLLTFGLPIGPAKEENGRQVQYFERARLEYFPDLAGSRYEVQIGHLGVASLETGRDR